MSSVAPERLCPLGCGRPEHGALGCDAAATLAVPQTCAECGLTFISATGSCFMCERKRHLFDGPPMCACGPVLDELRSRIERLERKLVEVGEAQRNSDPITSLLSPPFRL